MALFPFRGAKSRASTSCDPAVVKSLIGKESGNDTFRFPQDTGGSQKANGLFATHQLMTS
jgi:hypothetical protein